MTTQAKSRVKESIEKIGAIEITIVDDNDSFVEDKTFTTIEEAVTEIEWQESIGNQCFL